MNLRSGTGTRAYRQRRRAVSTAQTHRRIVDAAVELSLENYWYDEVTLRQIAAKAGVALQTVVNHFGTKGGVLLAVIERPVPEEMMTRTGAVPGDVEDAVRRLAHDYELAGDATFRWLALEERLEEVRPLLEWGRREHRDWVERTFPDALAGLGGEECDLRLELLVCATDVLTWKQLRRDRGLSRARTEEGILELVEALHR